ncbi:MAG: hypothetical protein J7513_01135 [Solirubrobacteraceae bacterium]|nr:hypothetical protein [Solirubrobacteraceae bacterium]
MGTFRDGTVTQFKRTTNSGLPQNVVKLLAKQRDVVAYRQLREHKLTPRAIDHRVMGGVLRPLPGRVLTTRRGKLGRDAQRWAALLSGPPSGRLTARSALALDGIAEHDESGDIYVLVEGGTPRRTAGVVFRRTKRIDPSDKRIVNDTPSVSTARALCDAAAHESVEQLAEYVDRAVMLGKFDGGRLELLLRRHRNLRGRHKLLAALATLDENSGRFRSIFERRVLRLVEEAGDMPGLVVNVLLAGYRPDLHRPGTAAIIECDGRDYHRSPAQIVADDERETRLRALGYQFLRLRWADLVYAPEATVARIRAFLAANAGPPVPSPREPATDASQQG